MNTSKTLTTIAFFTAIATWGVVAIVYTDVADTNLIALANSIDRASSSHADPCEQGLGAPGCPKDVSDQTGAAVHVTDRAVTPVSNNPTAPAAPATSANADTYADPCENGLGTPGCAKNASDRAGTVIRSTNGVVIRVSNKPAAPATSANADTYADPCENGLGTPGCAKNASDRAGTVVRTTNGAVTYVSGNPTAPAASADTYADPCENGLGTPGCAKDASDRSGTVVYVD